MNGRSCARFPRFSRTTRSFRGHPESLRLPEFPQFPVFPEISRNFPVAASGHSRRDTDANGQSVQAGPEDNLQGAVTSDDDVVGLLQALRPRRSAAASRANPRAGFSPLPTSQPAAPSTGVQYPRLSSPPTRQRLLLKPLLTRWHSNFSPNKVRRFAWLAVGLTRRHRDYCTRQRRVLKSQLGTSRCLMGLLLRIPPFPVPPDLRASCPSFGTGVTGLASL
jgi:hypothetical protein